MPKPKVFVTRKIPEPGISLLKKKCQVKVWNKDSVISRRELEKGVKWCDALLCLLTDKIDEKLLSLNPNLRVVSNYAVGYNNIDVDAATNLGIPVTNTPGVLTDSVAEHAIALMMSIARRIPESDRYCRAGKYKGWAPELFLGSQIKGKTLGIVGLGRIGSAVAERAVALGMNVVYFNRSRKKDFEKQFKAKYMKLNDVMKKADFISVHLPLTKGTVHAVGKKQIALMKKTAYLINTSRGPVIEEKALYAALKKKKIAGAAIDVYECEPMIVCDSKKERMVSGLENVVFTPHTASATIETRSKMAELAANNLLAAVAGKKTEVYGE